MTAPVPTPGSTIGHYEIIRSLGRGGMAEVWLARDTRLDRSVALKLVETDENGEPQHRNALREARLASAVSHPNIAHVYEVGEAGGRAYIAMEYVEGQTLETLIAGNGLEQSRIVDIALQIAQALAEAHRCGVIHRDLKPSNVVVSNRGAVKVLDFGLAKATRPRESIESLSAGGTLVGTVTYMSPEQAVGQELDGRSDIFSFGVLLYEMIARRSPFSGTTPAQTLMQILNDRPAPLRQGVQNASPALGAVVERCLEKRRENRYATADELVADLKKISVDARARVVSGRYLFRKHRRSVALAAVAAFVVAAAAVAGVWWATNHRSLNAAAITNVAVMPFTAVPAGDASQSIGDGLTETLINRLSRLPRLRVVSRPTVFSYKGKTYSPLQLRRELNVHGLLTGRVSVQGDRVDVQAELIDAQNDRSLWGEKYSGRLRDLVAIQDRIGRDVMRELDIGLTRPQQEATARPMTRDPHAYQLYLQGRYLLGQRGSIATRKAIQYFQQALRLDPQFAYAQAALAEGWIRLVNNRGIETRKGYETALAEALKAQRMDPLNSDVETLLGDIAAYHRWDFAAAERHFQQAIALNPNSITAHHWYALYLTDIGRVDDALRELRIARSLDPAAPRYITASARALYYARRYREAEAEARKAIDLDPKSWSAYDVLALILYAQGRGPEWFAAFRQYQINKGRGDLAPVIDAAWKKGGERAVRAAMVRDAEKRQAAGKKQNLHDWTVAAVRAGDYDRAFQLFERLYVERPVELLRLRTSPVWDPIRDDPRYWSLVQRLGLPEPQNSDRNAPVRPADAVFREARSASRSAK